MSDHNFVSDFVVLPKQSRKEKNILFYLYKDDHEDVHDDGQNDDHDEVSPGGGVCEHESST